MTPWLKKVLIIVVISLILSEIVLRLIGFKPGYWGKFEGFYPVDSLILAKNFVTDEYGIYKFGPWVTDSLKKEKHFNWKKASLESNAARNAVRIADNVSYIYATFKKLELQGREDYDFITRVLFKIALEEKEDWETEFTHTYHGILKKTNPDKLEKAIVNYVSSPFNEEGFRGIDFKIHDATKIRILLIGDSFVYGMSCTPYFNSYADILLSRGYEVYNTGIPGVGSAQYVGIAKKYVPLLKPDMVILNFCVKEDLMRFPRVAEKDKPHEHASNAGFFDSYPLGQYLSPMEAYDYYLGLIQIPDVDNKPVNWICSKLVITSFLWGQLMKNGYLEHNKLNEYYNFQHGIDDEVALAITKPYLKTIDSICAANQVELFNILVPDKSASNSKGKYVNIDTGLAESLFSSGYYNPGNIFLEDDFHPNQDHFNNSGALKFADFIEKVINENYIKEQ